MEARTYVCLFDLKAYDERLAPAMRRYVKEFEPADVVKLLEKAPGDNKHWIDSIGPDRGFRPSDQTVQELCEILIPAVCLPKTGGVDPQQDAERLVPWLTERSEWFADLMDGGEELAGGRLEFGFGDGRLVATREQIEQFREEVDELKPPNGGWQVILKDFDNLKKMLEVAMAHKEYTLFKTSITRSEVPQHQ